jgi:hypothetical protein
MAATIFAILENSSFWKSPILEKSNCGIGCEEKPQRVCVGTDDNSTTCDPGALRTLLRRTGVAGGSLARAIGLRMRAAEAGRDAADPDVFGIRLSAFFGMARKFGAWRQCDSTYFSKRAAPESVR